MSKHEVLTGVSSIGKSKKRLKAGDVLDSTLVTEDELAFFLARGAIGPATTKVQKPAPEAKNGTSDVEGDDD